MEIRDYLRIVRRHWPVITALTMATVAVAAAFTFLQVPQYSSSAQLFISTPGSDTAEAYTGGLFSQQRVASYADLADNRQVAEEVAEEVALDIDPEELAGRVTATAVPETVLLEIAVTDPDPEMAQQLAQTYATTLRDFIADLENPPGDRRAPIAASIAVDAQLPSAPVSPQPVRNLAIALVLGLLLGIGVAVLRETLDTSVKSPADAFEHSGAPVVGNIAHDSTVGKKPLLSDISGHAPRAEAFRVLRTNMQFLDVDKQSKVITLTSSLPQEGKTTTAVNLAIALAQAGTRTLLIDADLRRPKVAETLGLEGSVGLTTVLLGKVSLHEAVQTHVRSGLRVLTSGAIPPNPAELLQSQTMADFLASVRGHCDVVLFDSPPLLPVTDAALLASQSDGAILVIRHGKTTREQLGASIQRLENVGARTLGVVLNLVPTRLMNKSSYGYGYGYGYGYAPEAGRRKSRGRAADEGNTEPEDRGWWQPRDDDSDGPEDRRSA